MGIDPISLAIIGATVVSAGASIVSGRQQKKAADKQAAIMERESKEKAESEKAEAERVRKLQKVAFLSSGVTLEGSPLLVMEETSAQGRTNAQRTVRAGADQASVTRQQGRAALVGGFGDAASKGASAAFTLNQLK